MVIARCDVPKKLYDVIKPKKMDFYDGQLMEKNIASIISNQITIILSHIWTSQDIDKFDIIIISVLPKGRSFTASGET